MDQFNRIGIDTSKSVFQPHGVDAEDRPVLVRKLRRTAVVGFFSKLAPTRIGMEACGGSHYWARTLRGLGHEVVLIAAQHVKPYVRRGKHDAADAEACCEAMSRPRTRFVAVKSEEQQARQMLFGVRDQLVRRRTQLANAIRGHAMEFGLVVAKGHAHIEPLLKQLEAGGVPELAKELFVLLGDEYRAVAVRLAAIEKKLIICLRDDEAAKRLSAIPGVGTLGAVMLSVKTGDALAFRSGRDFAAWLGLTPKNHSTAGRNRLGVITRAGDERLRQILVVGATAHIQQARRTPAKASQWLAGLLQRKPPKLVAVAFANKTARIAWRMMVTGEPYQRGHATNLMAGAPAEA